MHFCDLFLRISESDMTQMGQWYNFGLQEKSCSRAGYSIANNFFSWSRSPDLHLSDGDGYLDQHMEYTFLWML